MTRSITFLLCCAFSCSAAFAQRAKPADAIWAASCAKCHGENGQGGGPGNAATKTLLTDELWQPKHDRPFFDAVKSGTGEGMPADHAFGDSMSDEQVWALVNRIRELQAGARRDRVGSISKKPGEDGFVATERLAYRITYVLGRDADLKTPWSMAILPDGQLLVTNRDDPQSPDEDHPGFISVFGADRKPEGRVANLPKSLELGQGGLMDITLHPQYGKGAGQDWVYLAYTEKHQDGSKKLGMTKVVRGKIAKGAGGWSWSEQQTIFEAKKEHYLPGGVHFGCKIVFDPKDANVIYFGIGERGHQEMAQDIKRPNGKIHRVHADGSIPKDNPFVGRDGAYESIWSYGHRNPQGLTFDLDGRLWDTEHAPRGGDELNLIERGKNYGWPLVSFGINYNGTPFKTPWVDTSKVSEAIEMPVDRWMPSIAACGLEVVRSEKFKGWRGDLLAGGLAGNNIDRVRIRKRLGPTPTETWQNQAPVVVEEREEVVHGLGRVRDIVEGPDGFIYVVTNGPDRVIRLEPRTP